ncbi:MAG: DUF1858 domain-containing protein [Clostridiales bacterium]|nr:DUF1858 domain-containing protein [Clostridiales bacterium]
MITKDMLIADALREGNAEAMERTLAGMGMHCIGCMLAHGETIEQAAAVHNLDPDKVVEALNEAAKMN